MTALIAASRDALAKALCTVCRGKGRYLPHCSACSDSTYDHDCPGWQDCDHSGAYTKVDALLSSGAVIDAATLAVPEDHIRSGAEQAPLVATVMEHIDRRMRWASLHWGNLHPDAWPHIAAAACRGVAAALAERGEQHG